MANVLYSGFPVMLLKNKKLREGFYVLQFRLLPALLSLPLPLLQDQQLVTPHILPRLHSLPLPLLQDQLLVTPHILPPLHRKAQQGLLLFPINLISQEIIVSLKDLLETTIQHFVALLLTGSTNGHGYTIQKNRTRHTAGFV